MVLATLLEEGREPPTRRNYHAFCGAARVIRRSGKRRIVTRRLARNARLQNALYHWARVAVEHDPRSHVK
jgi:Transposase IS116/IS110/IS902 family